MNYSPVAGVCVALAFAGGCGGGGHATPGNDGGGMDEGVEVSGPDVGGPDDLDGDDVSTITPCSPSGPPIELVCSGYCSNLESACTGGNGQFASSTACLEACTAPTWSCGTSTDPTGNTIFCRISHAMAATSSPDTECPQAGPQSAACI